MVWRRIAGVVAGAVVAMLVVFAAEAVTHRLYPFPAGMNQNDFEQIKSYVAALPATAYILVLTGWLVGTLAGTFVAARLGRWRGTAYILGALLLGAGIYNAIVIPQPVWFSVVSFIIYISMTTAGAWLGARNGVEGPVPAP